MAMIAKSASKRQMAIDERLMQLRSERINSATSDRDSREGSIVREGNTELRKSSVSTVHTSMSAFNNGARASPRSSGPSSPAGLKQMKSIVGEPQLSSLRRMSTIERVGSLFGTDKADSAKDVIWNFMESPSTSPAAYVWSIIMLLLIMASCSAFVLETMPSLCCGRYDHIWNPLEAVCIIFFTIEYACRFLACPLTYGLSGDELRKIEQVTIRVEHHEEARISKEWMELAFRARLRFLLGVLNLIDLVAIIPFYVSLLLGGGADLAYMRVIRLVRVFRLLKVGKYSEGLQLLGNTLVKSMKAMAMLGFFLSIAVILFSSLSYFVERGVWCDESNDFCKGTGQKFGHGWYSEPGTYKGATYTVGCDTANWCRDKSTMDSIFMAGYWALSTMTTTGYGDIVPRTPLGMITACIVTFCGLILLALPITVISGNFATEYAIMEYNKYNRELQKERQRRDSGLSQDLETYDFSNALGSEYNSQHNTSNDKDSNTAESQTNIQAAPQSPLDKAQPTMAVTINRSLLAPPKAEPPPTPVDTPTSRASKVTPRLTAMDGTVLSRERDSSSNTTVPSNTVMVSPVTSSASAGQPAESVGAQKKRTEISCGVHDNMDMPATSSRSPGKDAASPSKVKISKLKPLPAPVQGRQAKPPKSSGSRNKISPLDVSPIKDGPPVTSVSGQGFGHEDVEYVDSPTQEWAECRDVLAQHAHISDEEIIGIVRSTIMGEGFGYGGNAAANARRRASIESNMTGPLVPPPSHGPLASAGHSQDHPPHPRKLSMESRQSSQGSFHSATARSIRRLLETHRREVMDGICQLLKDSTSEIVKQVMEEQEREFDELETIPRDVTDKARNVAEKGVEVDTAGGAVGASS